MIILIFAFAIAIRYSFLYMSESTDYNVTGVDVSLYQGEIDWNGLAKEGFDFAFIKATEGAGYVDDNYEFNRNSADRAGLRVSAYHFLSYDSSGHDQAKNYIDTVENKWRMLPPSVDVEFYGDYEYVHPSEDSLHEVLDEFLAEVESYYRKKPIIYTNKYIYKKYISGHYDDYMIWISDFNVNEKLHDGRDWTFCQYTFEGRSENISNGEKNVDLDIFNGSKWDLRFLR